MDRDHIIKMPIFYLVMLLLETALATMVFALLIPYKGPDIDWPGMYRYMMFLGPINWNLAIYYVASTFFFAFAYNCWAWLICQVYLTIAWFAIWIDIVLWCAKISYDLTQLTPFTPEWDPWRDPYDWTVSVTPHFYAAAALGGVNTVIMIICTILYGRALHRHRCSGAPYAHNSKWRVTDDNPNGLPRISSNRRRHHQARARIPKTQTSRNRSANIYELEPQKPMRAPAYARDS